MKKLFFLLVALMHLSIFAEDVTNTLPLQTRCVRIKLKPGCLDETRSWFKNLSQQKDEVLSILKEQGVYVECVFLDQIDQEYYLIYFMKEEDTQKSLQVSSQSTHQISLEHKKYKKKCWEEKVCLEPLLDLDRILHY